MNFERERSKVERTKAQYPVGTRIRLNSMEDPYAPVPPDTEGEVIAVDSMGTLHMKWSNGLRQRLENQHCRGTANSAKSRPRPRNGDGYVSVNANAPRKYILRPAAADEYGLFYSMSKEKDAEFATVGHLRADFGDSDKKFWSTWSPHNGDELNTLVFSAELDEVMSELRDCGPLKSLDAMAIFCHEHGGAMNDGRNGYGYIAESANYRYAIRCTPQRGDYNAYVYAFDKRQQELNMVVQKPDEGMTMGGQSL